MKKLGSISLLALLTAYELANFKGFFIFFSIIFEQVFPKKDTITKYNYIAVIYNEFRFDLNTPRKVLLELKSRIFSVFIVPRKSSN